VADPRALRWPELAYACDEAACVNPGHAREIPLPGETRWLCCIVEKVTCRAERLRPAPSPTTTKTARATPLTADERSNQKAEEARSNGAQLDVPLPKP
jgi:hypothetical protein